MKKLPCLALIASMTCAPLVSADPPKNPVKGTMCTSNNLMVPGEKNPVIQCRGIGQFAGVAEIYERGYRVISSGFLPDPRPGFPPLTYDFYLIIEERK